MTANASNDNPFTIIGSRIAWEAPRWYIEIQAGVSVSNLEVWVSYVDTRTTPEFLNMTAGGGSVYGNTRLDQQVPSANTP